MIRLNNMRALIYLQDKIVDYFNNNEYIEGSYNDNCFVENCHDDYLIADDGTDGGYLSFLIDGFLSDELGIKLSAYFFDTQEGSFPSNDEFCDREIEYIDWAFAHEPYLCSWDVEKYREVKEQYPSGIHLKWKNNKLTDWWETHKDQFKSVQDEMDERNAEWEAEYKTKKDNNHLNEKPW